MRKISFYLYAVISCFLIGTLTQATFVSAQSSLLGVITNIKDLPIESAELNLKGKNTKIHIVTFSDLNGFFEFQDLEPDTYKVTAKRKGYRKSIQIVDLAEGENKEIEIIMKYSLTGKWRGYFETSLRSRTGITVRFNQSGKNIEGTLNGGRGISGTITGTLDADTAKFTFEQTTPCSGRFNGVAIISEDGDEMEFTVKGNNCLGRHRNGSGILNRK